MAQLKEKSAAVLEYLQQHDNGEGVRIDEIAEALNMTPAQVRPCVSLSLARAPKDGSRGSLAEYQKRDEDGKSVAYAVLTAEGREFVNEADTEE